MHYVQVDDDLYQWLSSQQERPFEPASRIVNRLLRDLAKLDQQADNKPREPRAPGVLAPYIEAGKIEAGTQLTWNRPRVGSRYTVTVTADGWLQPPDGPPFRSPSTAAERLVGPGRKFAGWDVWRLPNGQLLDSLR
jgi:Restriction Enzyme Adenine Methylase Associated/SeqA protein N-terminal domain